MVERFKVFNKKGTNNVLFIFLEWWRNKVYRFLKLYNEIKCVYLYICIYDRYLLYGIYCK